MNLLEAENAADKAKRLLALFKNAVSERHSHAMEHRLAEPVADDEADAARLAGFREGFNLAAELVQSLGIQDIDADDFYDALAN